MSGTTFPRVGEHDAASRPLPTDPPPADTQHPRPGSLALSPAGRVKRTLSRLGRALRFVAGVDEAVMDHVRPLRAWYASLGAVVVMTGVIAGCSMWFAVQQATSANPLVAVLPALVWAVFIIVVDRWIVSSRASEGWQRMILLITRGVLAILFGVVIAEPLVLRVFENQIEQQVSMERSTHLDELRANLVACNPAPDPADPTANDVPAICAENHYNLGIVEALVAKQTELKELKEQADDKSQKLADARTELARLQQMAANECAGASGPGLTGVYGEGINCQRNTQAAADFQASVPWTTLEHELSDLQRRVAALESEVSSTQTEFVEQRNERIEQRLANEPQPGDQIGLLQRMEVLHNLGAANFVLAVGVWLVRLLFIAIDCSPVLMKIASGKTAYDRWVEDSLTHAVDRHAQRLQAKSRELRFERESLEDWQRRQLAIKKQQILDEAVRAREEGYLRGRAAPRSTSDQAT